MSYSDSLQARREAAAARGRGGRPGGPPPSSGGGLNFSQPAAFSAGTYGRGGGGSGGSASASASAGNSGLGSGPARTSPPPQQQQPVLGVGSGHFGQMPPQQGVPLGMQGSFQFGGHRGGFVNTNARLGMQSSGPIPGPQPTTSSTSTPPPDSALGKSTNSDVPPEKLEEQRREQQQREAAARIAKQFEAFGVSAMIQPGAGQTESALFAENQSPEDVLSYVPKRGLVQCYVERHKTGLLEKNSSGVLNHPYFILNTEKGNRFVCCARKRANKSTSNFLVSLNKDDMSRTSDFFFGKVRAKDVVGSAFVIYDNGDHPGPGIPSEKWRRELAAVIFEPNPGGIKGPKKMWVVLPTVNKQTGEPEVWRPINEDASMVSEWKRNKNSDKLVILTNKEATWNEQIRAYQLNFHGRVTASSVKNFQLTDARNPGRVVMQFGKNAEDRYAMDYQAPLSAYQAFGIALTACDNKLAVD